MGICNGFQILCEAGLLPGALLRNKNLRFICDHVNIRVEATDTPYTSRCRQRQVLSVPIAHGDGNYFCDAETLELLSGNHYALAVNEANEFEVIDHRNADDRRAAKQGAR